MCNAIVVAAGSSQRMGFDKLFADLSGRPVAAWSVAAFQECAEVENIIIVTRPDKEPAWRELAERWQWSKLRAILPGGAQRQDSVWIGLQYAAASAAAGALVAVHDGARPLVTPQMISRCLEAARENGAACCAAPVSDTLKRADAAGRITDSVDRAHLWAMHTPQIFRQADLIRAYRRVLEEKLTITDEASALEHAGQAVYLVNSGDFNLKITYPEDLEPARHLLAQRAGSNK